MTSRAHVLLVDPDAKSFSGHYMAYNDKLSAEMARAGETAHVVSRKDIDASILSSHPSCIPSLSDHSWEINDPKSVERFEKEMREIIAHFCSDASRVLVYMYCGSLPHAKALASIQKQHPGLSVHINLFWLSVWIDAGIQEWKEFLGWASNQGAKFVATLPTEELRDRVFLLSGAKLPVAPHPSTGLSDEQFAALNRRKATSSAGSKIRVLFPGSPRFEKGYGLSIDAVRHLGNLDGFHSILRHAPTFSSPKELSEPLGAMPENVRIVEGELSDSDFLDLFDQSDLAVLPYIAQAFAMRTSGLLIDAIYHCVPCVVMRGTWLATFVERHDCGVVVTEESAEAIVRAIKQIAARHAYYHGRAHLAAQHYFAGNSWAAFVQFILSDWKRLKEPGTRSNVAELDAIVNDQQQRVALVMGNGPSAKLLDFDLLRLGHVASLGMNAAYRHWDRIDFRPTYYICMDTVVIQSHARRIVELIQEGRIKKFFLRDELKELHPEVAGHPRVYWFSAAQAESELFRSKYVTTGSWAIRWMLHEGMRLVATIGTDANYTELISEAKRLGTESDLRLEITRTPDFNPNYFFADYQQAGDRYNIPNSPGYLKATGRLLHVDALRDLAKDVARLGIDSKIVDLSPISDHGTFEKARPGEFFGKLQLSLITSFHVKLAPDVLESNVRVALANCANPFISSVRILLEGDRSRLDGAISVSLAAELAAAEDTGKLAIESISQRPSYRDLLERANTFAAGCVCIANSDVVVPYGTAARVLIDRFSVERPIFALTRWNLTDGGQYLQGVSASPPWAQVALENLSFKEKNFLSFDAYIFDVPVQVPAETSQILIGSLGCDTALVGSLRANGFALSNPCLAYRVIHVDDKPRQYQSERAKKDLVENVAVVRRSVLPRYSTSVGIPESLEKLGQLRSSLAWIGGPRTMDAWHALYRAVGSVPWSASSDAPKFQFKKISVSASELAGSRLELGMLVQELSNANVFVEWELSGFDKDGHIVDLLIAHQHYKAVGLELEKYQWQSSIHVDRAPQELRSIHADLLLVLRDLLLEQAPHPARGRVNLKPASRQSQPAKKQPGALISASGRDSRYHLDETAAIAQLFANEPGESHVMIDVGAHHGTALAHFVEKAWRVFAFEPDDSNREELDARLSKHPNGGLVKVDARAISNESKSEVSFYTSDVSTGISSLSAFHASHRKSKQVDTVTLREALRHETLSSIDFLKIDTEGHDLFVLEGFPWERLKPAVIECEFEDSKTSQLGYSFHDLANFLVEKGYTIYVSEWHPIIRYGIRHDWNRLARYPCKLSDSKAWGNLLAFRDGIDETKLVEAVRKVLSVGAAAKMPAAAQAEIKEAEPARTEAAKLEVALPSPASSPSSATMFVTTPHAPAEPVPPPAHTQRVVMQMHDATVGEGWYAPESEEWGQFRWTGPGERATLNIPVKRDREMLLVAAYHTAGNPEQLSELRVEADGAAVWHSIHANLNPKCVVARVPACAKQPGESTELAFVVRTVSPESQPGGNSDKRLLGLAVFWVALIPAEPALPVRFPVSRFEWLRRRMDRSRRDAPSADFALSHFDGLAYMEAYPDVADAVLAGSIPSALEHYLRHGCKEGRRFALAVSGVPSAGGIADLFEGLGYLDAYPDVAEAVRRQEIPSAFYHYMEYGRNEGRTFKRAVHGKARRGTLYELLAQQFQIELGRRTEAVKQELEKQFAARQAPFRNQLLGLEKAVGASVRSDQLETLREEVQQSLSVAARSEDVARLSQQAESLQVSLTEVQQDLSAAARSDDVVRLRREAEALQAGLAQVQQDLSGAARSDDLARLRQQTESLQVSLTEVQQDLSAAARSDDVVRLRREAEALQAGLAQVQQGFSGVARREELERLERDATHNLERMRTELASMSAVRDAREQTLGARLEGLKFSIEQAQKGLSAAARQEDLERLQREATQNLERIQIAAAEAAREAHEQLAGLEMDSLKAGVDSARTRAELAEVRVASMQREIGAETRQLSESLSELGKKLESETANAEKLKAELTALRTQAASDHARIADPKLNALNVLHYQAFPRTLAKANAERLLKHWAPILKMEIQEKELYYLAHRICNLEDLCQGRLAASIQDVLLRILVARGTKTKDLKILEIGTLFGIGIIAMHEALVPLFESIHFTVMDPLEGYYGADNRDILTGVPVTCAVFEENLRRAGVARERVELIQLLSTEAGASKRLSQKRFDLLVIDADHTYAGVKNDATKFIRRVGPGGHVIFDDYGNSHWPDVKKYVDAEIMPRKDLKFIGAEWNTAVFRVRTNARKVALGMK